MTVTSPQSSVTLLGNGATTVFSFPFIGVAPADITVTYTDPNNVVTVLNPSQYILTLNAPVPPALWGIGGTVTFTVGGNPIPNNSLLNISRTVPYTQLTTLANQGASYPQVVEQSFDLLDMQIQQLFQLIQRCFSVFPTDPNPATVIPAAARANQNAAFDANGNLVAGATATAFVSVAMQPVVAAATIAAAQALLGIAAALQYNYFLAASVSNSTNAYTVTLQSNQGTLGAYASGLTFEFFFNANPTGLVTVQIGSLGFKNLYWNDGTTQVGSDASGILNRPMLMVYDSTLNSSAGGFRIITNPLNAPIPGIAGSYTAANVTLDEFGRITAAANGLTGLTPFELMVASAGGVISQIPSLGALGQVLTSQGAGALPQWTAPSSGSGTLVSVSAYTTSQTITIPAGATKAVIKLAGASGGSSTGSGQGSGAGAVAIAYLTGLTAGLTLVLTVGAGGLNTGAAGGSSTLASGSQTISTITAGGGTGSTGASAGVSAGGVASGGNIANRNGQAGVSLTFITSVGSICTPSTSGNVTVGGANAMAPGGFGGLCVVGAGYLPGTQSTAGIAGIAGGMEVWWFT